MPRPLHPVRRLLTAALLAPLVSCGTDAVTPLPPAPPSHVVSGIVFETVDGVRRPVAAQMVFLWVRQGPSSRAQYVRTDQNGRYTAQVPDSRVFAYASGAFQPCVASAWVSANTTIDVEVVSPGRSSTPPPNASPMVSGVVYEKTPTGRIPLRGAKAWIDAAQEAYVAYVETDAAGRFFLCRVDIPARLDVWADGLQPYQHWKLIPGTGDELFEFEFSR